MNIHKVIGKGFYARIGDFFGPLRPDAKQAEQALTKELELFHPLDHTYIRCGDGTFIHIYQMVSHGWNYKTIHPNGEVGGLGAQTQTKQEIILRALAQAEEQFGGGTIL